VDFRKEMTFEREFRFQVAQKITGFVVTGCLAFLWRDYWALVAGILASHSAGLVLSYVLHPFRPRLALSQWRPLVQFTKWLLANNILNFVVQRADVFILGRLVSPHELGLYAVAREISNLPTTELMWPVQRALFPGFAKLAHDPLALAGTYVDSAAVLLAIALPAAVGLALVADPLVRVTLGGNWIAVIPLLQVLAVQGAVRLGGSLTIAALLAAGRPKLTTVIAVTTAAVQTPLLIVGALSGGTVGMAIAFGVAAVINLIFSLALSLTALKVSPLALLGAVWRTGAATLFMSGAAWAWIGGFGTMAGLGVYPLLQLFSGAAVGAVCYVAVHLLLWRLQGRVHGSERIILDAAGPWLGRHWRRGRGARAPERP
jgi:O-antigen/teichoic acid export membrane protein